jgi:hypothetical protein
MSRLSILVLAVLAVVLFGGKTRGLHPYESLT